MMGGDDDDGDAIAERQETSDKDLFQLTGLGGAEDAGADVGGRSSPGELQAISQGWGGRGELQALG